MLKIKDNVDLKELEKYGFKKDELLNTYIKVDKSSYDWEEIICQVKINDRTVWFNKNQYTVDTMMILLDGLVEKVDDK